MIKLSVLYGHPKDPDAFEKYYAETHKPIAQKMLDMKTMPGVRRIELAKVLGAPGGAQPPYYRTADLYFDSVEHLQSVLGSPEGKATADDLANFATGGAILMISEVA